MPSYKLTYFNVMARAEPIRVLFAQAGVEYEDCRIKGEEWQALKPKVPSGGLPILEVDGKMLTQSKAIERYVAKELNLAGSNAFETAQCDAVIEAIVECQQEIKPLFAEKDEEKKVELRKEVLEKMKPKLARIQDSYLAPNGDVFVGKTITVADIELFVFAELVSNMLKEDPLANYPKLSALREKVGKEPKIAAWVKKRPVTSF